MFIHGKNTRTVIGGVDISTFTKKSDVTDGVAIHKVTTYGPNRARESKAGGLGDGKITLTGTHDNGLNAPGKVIPPLMDVGAEVAFLLQKQGQGSGLPQLSVNVIISAYNESFPSDDMIQWTCELEMSGTVNRADQP